MRTTSILALALLLAVAGPGLSERIDSAAPQGSPAYADVTTQKNLRATVIDVNIPERLIKVYGTQLDDYTLEVTAETRIRRGERAVTLESIRPGEMVNIVYVTQDARNLLLSLTAE